MTLKSLKPTKTILLLALTGLLAGCASQGSSDNAIGRKFSWFSYMEGGDIRAACAPGAAARYRLVYNAVYGEQVRTYDLDANGGLDVRVIEPVNLKHISIHSLADVLSPWRGKTASTTLSVNAVEKIEAALLNDGVFGPPAIGTELSSKGFFWTIAACRQGRYSFTALAWPSPAWDAMSFDQVLFGFDPVAVRVNPPRKTALGRNLVGGEYDKNKIEFHTKVGENGLYGTLSLGQ
ncbi:MAG: hypothetical protein JKY27_07605 [Magnetovibrio sp.]|nr:hypothetical protein [Magnetovibrio sp.]